MGLKRERHRRKISFLRQAEFGGIEIFFHGIVEGNNLRPLEPDHVQDHTLILPGVAVLHKIEKAAAKIPERIGFRRASGEISFHPTRKVFVPDQPLHPREIFPEGTQAACPVISDVNFHAFFGGQGCVGRQKIGWVRRNKGMFGGRSPDGIAHPPLQLVEILQFTDPMNGFQRVRRSFAVCMYFFAFNASL